MTLTLRVLEGALAIARLGPDAVVPAWASRGALLSLTRTANQLSIVCEDVAVPPDVRAERGFRALRVEGTLDFSLTGVLASLAAPLAQAGVSLFALSTFDTDYLLVRERDLPAGLTALRRAGHRVIE